jgi:RNA polymerase-binding transcription factor DksA
MSTYATLHNDLLRQHHRWVCLGDAANLTRYDHALARVIAHTWGSCEDCGQGIDERRLQRDPAATRCWACANSPVALR